jgi:hypothetical protein
VILQPSVLALEVAGAATAGLVVYAAGWGLVILRGWDLRSGSSRQLALERRTFLVSTILGWALAFELASAFLFVYTADALAPLFTGAMCAAGTLQASGLGYPVLLLKLANVVLAGVWLALNHADGLGYDYPLVRVKYAALLGLAPLVVVEAALQTAYFSGLHPEIITSCCGSRFAREGQGLGAELASLPALPTAVAFFAVAGAAVLAAIAVRRTGRFAGALGALAGLSIPVSLAAVVAFVSPYVYALPTHHCPFCLLQQEYRFVGYPLYAAILGGGVAGLAAGAIAPFRAVPSLAAALPPFQRRLATTSAVLLAAAVALAALLVAASDLHA